MSPTSTTRPTDPDAIPDAPAEHRSSRERPYLAVTLITATVCLAMVMYVLERASLLEAIGFVSGALCVWMVVRQNIWNFPLGLVNVATLCVVFFQTKLFADASLQVVYIGLNVWGWYFWLYGGENRTVLQVGWASWKERAIVICVGFLLTLVFWQTLHLVGGSAKFWDAITTALSLCAQWLLNRKKIESWYLWIAADVIYIPLYLSQNLVLTAVLYCIFLALCFMGLREWQRSLHQIRKAV
jgi:nicotinamide mononucleotide transporter